MRRLLTLRWIIGHLVVTAVTVACVLLGFWQLDRLDQRRTANAVQAARYSEEPLPIDRLVELAGDDLESLEFRRATARGEYRPDQEVLIRSQVLRGVAGFHVVTPLVSGEWGVAVDRGWVPLEFDTVPVAEAPPPEGAVEVTGVVRLSRQRAALGREDTAQESTLSRVDVGLIDERVDADLVPVYLAVVGEETGTALPATPPPPDFTDDGPHLSYAIQWFSFAAVGAIGYGFLLRRALRGTSVDGNRQAVDDLDSGQTGQVGP